MSDASLQSHDATGLRRLLRDLVPETRDPDNAEFLRALLLLGGALFVLTIATYLATTDWAGVPATHHPGETGAATWRTLDVGDVRVRMVEYSPGYRADHWCERGHILLVLEGELVTELADGNAVTLRPVRPSLTNAL